MAGGPDVKISDLRFSLFWIFASRCLKRTLFMLRLCQSHQGCCWSSLLHSEIIEVKQVAFCGVYVYHKCDWSAVMGGIVIATTDIWSVHCYREERIMKRQGDDGTWVRIHPGHQYRRETDWNPDSVTGARNRAAEIERLWFDMNAGREDSEWVFRCPVED